MKITFRILPAVVILFMVASCTSKPSDKIQQSFNTKYEAAKDLHWKNVDGNWDATFELEGVDYTALFNANGSWMRTRHNIDFDGVPQEVWDAFSDKFEQKYVKAVGEVEMKDETFYAFDLQTQDEDYTVLYDKTGNFQSKEKREQM